MTRKRSLDTLQWGLVCAAVWVATPPQRSTPLRVLAVGSFLYAVIRLAGRTVVGERTAPVLRSAPVDLPPPGERQVRLARLETSLTYAQDSARQFDRTVRPLLVELTAERLRRSHGIEIEHSPAAARAIIGEELWQLFLDDPAGRADGPGPPPQRLAAYVAAVERV
ncbi:MAG TPA: hypothetical protein VNA14_05960 [Mycobacteriales bacterium]|nr:hypothetical protein [Mycobacteriales bacterium]